MHPILHPGKVIFALRIFKKLKAGDIVIIRHEGVEKVKRLKEVAGNKVYVLGDNPGASTDSRQFGWLDKSVVLAKVITKNDSANASIEIAD